jgi:hypothetical protein
MPRALAALLVLASLGLGAAAAQAQPRAAGAPAACTVPPAPAGDELHANADSSITMTWPASAGATSYNIYRGTTSGGEGNTPIASTTSTTTTGTGGIQTLPVTGTGRYVRMYGTQRATGYGYSLWEFQIYGS